MALLLVAAPSGSAAQLPDCFDLTPDSGRPAGYPCAPFKNQSKTIAFVKSTLVYNGFRPAMRIVSRQPRQVQLEAVRDGWRYFVIVARTGKRQVGMAFVATGGTPPIGPARIPTAFPP